MSVELTKERELADVEAFPENIVSIQPGGGAIQKLELCWGALRRRWLKLLRPGYVRRMNQRLHGDRSTCPVEIIDSRDLKLYRNLTDCYFEAADDRFASHGRLLPLARDGFAEIAVVGGLGAALIAASAILGFLVSPWLYLVAVPPALVVLFVLYFFRDPRREIPGEPGVVVSPADGKIIEVADVDVPEFIDEPAVKITIFLSVFNVHVNRISRPGRLIRLRYTPGKFVSAYKPDASDENERMELFFAEVESPHRRFIIRQISGLVARRIVCHLHAGETLALGERFGLIKFGSRTEILVPRHELEVLVKEGDMVRGGSTILGRYPSETETERDSDDA